jgi:alpha-beta hydrolase superfamily lysophospholipase
VTQINGNAAATGVTPAGDMPPLLRAVPPSRMLDYGMTGEDCAALVAAAGLGTWDKVAEELAEAHLLRANAFERSGSRTLAAQEREWAAAAFNIGQLGFDTDTPRRIALYARASEALATAAQTDPVLRRLEVEASGGGRMYGWETIVPGAIGSVVVIGGLSGWGMTFLGLARALAYRGVAAVLAEGPGQGETRMRSPLHLSRAALPEFEPFIGRARGQARSVALVGNSFGGLVAANLAATRPDIAALVVNCSPTGLRTPEAPGVRDQVSMTFGLEGDALEAALIDFSFDAEATPLNLPMLILEGGEDKLVPPGAQLAFLGHRGREDRSVLVRTWADGLHTVYNHANERNCLIASWLADRFREI